MDITDYDLRNDLVIMGWNVKVKSTAAVLAVVRIYWYTSKYSP